MTTYYRVNITYKSHLAALAASQIVNGIDLSVTDHDEHGGASRAIVKGSASEPARIGSTWRVVVTARGPARITEAKGAAQQVARFLDGSLARGGVVPAPAPVTPQGPAPTAIATGYRVHLSPKSSNTKTGPIPVSTTSAATCPTACPFRTDAAGGCYAASGPLALHWRAVTAGERGTDWRTFVASIATLPEGTLWRHNQAGDLPGDGVTIDCDALGALVDANVGRRGFTYTHYVPTIDGNGDAIAHANARGFTVNMSANDTEHADALAALAIGPVVAVLPSTVDGRATRTVRTPAGRTVVVCPATYRDDVSCATCALCARADRTTIVGFPAHGTGKARASRVASRIIPIARAA